MLFENFFDIENKKIVIAKVFFEEKQISASEFDEIESLVNVLNGKIVSYIWQKRKAPDSKFFIGSGKVDEIISEVNKFNADFVIFDNNLKPSHIMNLENKIGRKVFDRTEVILEIFRKHARTKEAKLEIELARLKYISPRLKRMWQHLEQISGRMMAGRGPGEKQIEADRRLIRKRIEKINEEIKENLEHKERLIENREKLLSAALLGYTNAGKTTIFNLLTKSNQPTSTELFTTLDTKMSWLVLPNKLPIYLVDTVGFIKDMPEHLLRAFHSTLKEALHSDILILVFDISRENLDDQIINVESILEKLNFKPIETIYIFNKIDKVRDQLKIISYSKKYAQKNPLLLSAISSDSKKLLIEHLAKITDKLLKSYLIKTDISNGKLISFIKNFLYVLEEKINSEKIIYKVKTHPYILQKLLNDFNIEAEPIS